ncbi:MAG: hypothetical protein MUO78_02985 [candidate division Zixibacteria bacterium]|nr:hypothetical protein [candidate division Zixibacteria bacterium]
MRKLFFILILMPGILFAQGEKKEDVWSPFKYFVGNWKGTGKGRSGLSKLEAEFKFVLNGKYLQVRGKAVFEPQEKNKKGEVHEDLGFISFDRARKTFIFRQFHVEGFVTQNVLDSLSSDEKTFVFLSEIIENIAPGWRVRATYKIQNENEFLQIFELAEPGKDFEVYSENQLKRKK